MPDPDLQSRSTPPRTGFSRDCAGVIALGVLIAVALAALALLVNPCREPTPAAQPAPAGGSEVSAPPAATSPPPAPAAATPPGSDA